MKKLILGVLCCTLPSLLSAQISKHSDKIIKAGKAAGTSFAVPKIPADVAVGLRPDYWKTATVIMDKLKTYQPAPIKVSILRYEEGLELYRTLDFKKPEVLRAELLAHGEEESARIFEQYRDDLKNFLDIKKEFDIFLGYQKFEPKPITFSEQTRLVKMLEEAQSALSGLSMVLGKKNPAIHYASLWVRNVYGSISPMAASLMAPAQESLLEKTFHEGRVFNVDEFLLKNPNGAPLRSPFATPNAEEVSEALGQAQQLPARTIAFLNDDPEILEWARDWGMKGYFGKGTRVATFDSMEKLVDWVTSGVKYDVIFLDYVLEDGLSVYVVDELRAAGNMETVVLLNSALEPHEVPSEDLFHHGVDGFVTSVGFRPDTGWVGITNALHNYEVYKAKNGWKR